MYGVWEGFISIHSFIHRLGTLPWQTILQPSLRHASVPKLIGLQDHNSDFRRLNGNDFSRPTLCRNLVKFGPVTPDFATLECVQLWRQRLSAPPRRASASGSSLVVRRRSTPVCRVMVGLGLCVLRSPPSILPCHKCSANSGPCARASFFYPLLSTHYVSGTRCVPKRITYIAGAFSIV